jgi:hypothetical protein
MVYVANWMLAADRRAPSHGSVGTPELKAERWPDCFAEIARSSEGVLVSVEVLGGRERLDRALQRPRDLRAIGYCPGRDMLELTAGGSGTGVPGLRYFISAPRQIHLEQSDARADILVQDASGTRTLIRLFNLPGPLAGLPGQRR